jgi:hypothetical protein
MNACVNPLNHEISIAREYAKSGSDRASENVKPEHPSNQAEGDRSHDDVANPLAGGLRLGSVVHGVILASTRHKKYADPATELQHDGRRDIPDAPVMSA